MPLKLVPPRKGKSSRYTIRGTYLGQRINRSTGTGDRAIAKQILRKIERDIERGAVSDRPRPNFASAARSYMRGGGERRFMAPLLKHFGEKPLEEIDQMAIDDAAVALYPNASAATRNRQVHTPITAVLKYAGVQIATRRPKGHQGVTKTRWLWPEEAEAMFAEAREIDEEFAAFLMTLCYTGLRLSEALSLEWRNVDLTEGFAYVEDTKTDEPRGVFLPPVVVAELANLSGGRVQRVFRHRKNGHLYTLLRRVRERANVERCSFHTFRHTWATWMRRYGGLDTKGLIATGAWRDRKSADRYAHVVVSEESRKALLLPVLKRASGGKNVE